MELYRTLMLSVLGVFLVNQWGREDGGKWWEWLAAAVPLLWVLRVVGWVPMKLPGWARLMGAVAYFAGAGLMEKGKTRWAKGIMAGGQWLVMSDWVLGPLGAAVWALSSFL